MHIVLSLITHEHGKAAEFSKGASDKKSPLGHGSAHCPDTKLLKLHAWFQNMGFLELQSYAAGILDNSPCSHPRCLNINVSCSVRKTQQELVLLCQLLDEFAAVEAAAPSE